MTAAIEEMNSRMSQATGLKKDNAHQAAQHAMRLLIRAGNQDRGLMEDLDWQQAMTYLNAVVKSTENP